MAARNHLGLLISGNLNGLHHLGIPDAPMCQISSKSVKWLQRYHDFFPFFKIADDGHLGFLNSGNLNS